MGCRGGSLAWREELSDIRDQISGGGEKSEEKAVKECKSKRVKERKRREFVALERKSPPFPPEAGEGWGTLKYLRWVARRGEPMSGATGIHTVDGGLR